MKTAIIFFVASLLGSIACYPQKPKNHSLNTNAYVGTWVYQTPADTFKIVLRKDTLETPRAVSFKLTGEYYYRKDGAVLDNHLPNLSKSSRNYERSIWAGNWRLDSTQINVKELEVYFTDRRYEKTLKGRLSLLSPTTMRMKLWESEGSFVILPGETPPMEGMSIPNNITLTKQRAPQDIPTFTVTEVHVNGSYNPPFFDVELRYTGPRLAYGSCLGCYDEGGVALYAELVDQETLTLSEEQIAFPLVPPKGTIGDRSFHALIMEGIAGDYGDGLRLQVYGRVHIVGAGWLEITGPVITTRWFVTPDGENKQIYP